MIRSSKKRDLGSRCSGMGVVFETVMSLGKGTSSGCASQMEEAEGEKCLRSKYKNGSA